ncbi:MarR family transcriptional regulator [Amycolatopsis rhabdoformis]|uniref:MarR family transcriptional regulator n=1 Tax=Amycolatopsis rhabdoformis TaxID=1448059 RepID=A0ABZ1HZC9_9PSEU|nr:MarR family transcriptional regulator [Amycolatopsis rhabdoformis]WSE26898.1 MarR family transcriptional regulator [Amycolatopsis rhabdoformis]
MTRRRSLAETRASGEGPLLGPLARRITRWFEDGVLAELAARGEERLTMTQIDIVAKLDAEGITIAELGRRAGVARQSAHQAVGELTRAGLVRVDPDPASARNKLVRPTEAGLARLEVAREVLEDLERKLGDRIGARRLEQLREALDLDWDSVAG